ncbi:putative metalloprotease CJM1_0395 family protein [Idiomarina xiamenensis]|uniref:SrpA-related protein n=1 Tax=Idiomarina xiamenensis 10-D-4 TaxID=740709 RepID=K2JDP2_9GAMM|nr:putative metalloprotease CJM1_0395 family protein [Idiomarina xiamenensis]EKE81521.1 hypothetical protein A10D4_10601 [Idiomarina xiamenensis 10-D-4]
MNITTALPNIPFPPAPAAEAVRKDNQQRELVRQPSANQSSQDSLQGDKQAEPQAAGVASNAKARGREDVERDARGRLSERNGAAEQQLSDEELQQLQDLQSRDREVRVHEQAHAAVGGQHAGSPSYSYERGPDGKSYATAGEVPIDVSVVANDPQATIQKMQQVQRAALAPAQPSAADRAIAADAAMKLNQARAELAQSSAPQSQQQTQDETSASSTDETDQTSATAKATARSDNLSDADNPFMRQAADVVARSERIATHYQASSRASENAFSAFA